MDNSCALAPLAVEHAITRQASRHPLDAEVLRRLFDYLRSTRPTMREIKDSVCEFYCLQETVLTGGGRNMDVSLARQVFCFLAYRHTRASLRMVGIQMGGLDHTTVLHAVQKLPKAIRNSPRLADEISQLEMRITEKVLLRSQGRF
jgi:chromosomal replication initiator protein